MKHKGPTLAKSLPEQPPMSVWETPANRRPPMWKRLLFGNPFRDCEPHVSLSIASSSLNQSSVDTPPMVSKPNLEILNGTGGEVGATMNTAPEISSIDPPPEGVVETSGEEDVAKESSNSNEMEVLSEALAATRLCALSPLATVNTPHILGNASLPMDLPPPPPPPLVTPRLSLPKVPKAPSSPRVVLLDRSQRSQSVSRPTTVSDRNQSFSSTGSRHRRSSGDWPTVETIFLEKDLSNTMVPTTIVPQKAQYARAVSVLSDLATDIEDENDDHIFDLSSDEEDNDIERGPFARSFSHDDSKDACSASPTTVLSPPSAEEDAPPAVDAPRWMLEWAQTDDAAKFKADGDAVDVNTTASCSTASQAMSASSDAAWVYCPVEPRPGAQVPEDPVIFTVGWAALLEQDQMTTTHAAELPIPPVTADTLQYIELLASGTLRSISASKEIKTMKLVGPSEWSVRDVCPSSLGKCLVLPMDQGPRCCYILPVHISAHALERLRLGKIAAKRLVPSTEDYAPTAQQETVLFLRFSLDAAYRMQAAKKV
jgi:hypothetical protein